MVADNGRDEDLGRFKQRRAMTFADTSVDWIAPENRVTAVSQPRIVRMRAVIKHPTYTRPWAASGGTVLPNRAHQLHRHQGGENDAKRP